MDIRPSMDLATEKFSVFLIALLNEKKSTERLESSSHAVMASHFISDSDSDSHPDYKMNFIFWNCRGLLN